MVVDTLGHLLARHVTAADVGAREAGAPLAADIQYATDDAASLADVDQGDTGATAAEAAAVEGIKLEVVKRLEAKARFRASAEARDCREILCLANRCRRPAKDYERYTMTLAGFQVIAFVGFMLRHGAHLMEGA
jgi:hypothetical protein